MSEKFELVKSYLHEIGLPIVGEEPGEEIVIVDDDENGIKNLIIDCEDPIVIMEQVIMKVPSSPIQDLFKRLLQMNRQLVHGAFVLDDAGETIIFRDTLQLENLDRNELEASIQALSLALAEFSGELLGYVNA